MVGELVVDGDEQLNTEDHIDEEVQAQEENSHPNFCHQFSSQRFQVEYVRHIPQAVWYGTFQAGYFTKQPLPIIQLGPRNWKD